MAHYQFIASAIFLLLVSHGSASELTCKTQAQESYQMAKLSCRAKVSGDVRFCLKITRRNHKAAIMACEESNIRRVPVHKVPVPNTVSPQLQQLIAAPLDPGWKITPKNNAQWKTLVAIDDAAIIAILPQMRETFGVTVEPMDIGGVGCYMVTPEKIPPENKNRLLVHMHGGGYVFGAGEAGTLEAIEMAGYGRFKVLSVNYRMPPDFPFPAALDDAMAVWKVAITMEKPENIAIFGSSAGGALTLAMVLRAKQENLRLPAAIACGTPFADMTKTGDTYFSNQKLDNVLVSYEGVLEAGALLYANGTDLKDPFLSPIYGDLKRFPPTILTTGTRDLFLSNTVRVHRKLSQCGVNASLNVFEGMSHADWVLDPFTPESEEAFKEISLFLNHYLGKA